MTSILQPYIRIFLLIAMMAIWSTESPAKEVNMGMFESAADIGPVKHPGSVVYDENMQEYTLSGSGTNMWFDHDEFFMVWKKMSGDFILRANLNFVGEGIDAHRKAGWIIRSSLAPDAAYVDVAVHGDGLSSMQYRRRTGAMTEEVKSPLTAPDVIQLERTNGRYIMSVARSGSLFQRAHLDSVVLGDSVYVGLFICAHNAEVVETARFSNVRIVVPPKKGYKPYQDYIGSNLEILDVSTGRRKIIYRSPHSIQAPNWTPDGKALIYNSNGLLYRYELNWGNVSLIDTDFARQNNNDHVLSFDGKMLGISHHSKEAGGVSIVYTLPAQGGVPKQITPLGPSYLHGWSPDGRYLVYTGRRNDQYDIYKIPAAGGQEIQLTNEPGLDDGPEYSPDGEYIYFNSERSGSMDIWRMRPDGSGLEKLTHDELNNWFPHISPDGKKVIFLSFLPDVPANSHPFYQQVYLRIMPADGGEPQVVAYVYGGQGTINVPSWSPDSRYVAFVSNSD